MEKVIVGMSGGVDSSVAAVILKEKGFEVTGYTLIFDDENNKCCRINDAKRVADELGIDYLTIDISEEFDQNIINYFLNEYKNGKTPSPCPRCNIFKFKLGLEYAEKHNIDYVATGHYAKIKNDKLYTADNRKDQAYFLSRLPKKYFSKILLPLGEYSKDKVREIAEKYNLHVASKDDSQDICFIEDDYRDFLKEKGFKRKKGRVYTSKGKYIDDHEGYFNYTIGQRYKMGGLPNKKYVIETDKENNRVIIGANEELFSKKMIIEDINIIADKKYLDKNLFFKIRSRDSFHSGKIIQKKDDEFLIQFKESVRAITPGQLAVFYYKENSDYLVVGSGWIKNQQN